MCDLFAAGPLHLGEILPGTGVLIERVGNIVNRPGDSFGGGFDRVGIHPFGGFSGVVNVFSDGADRAAGQLRVTAKAVGCAAELTDEIRERQTGGEQAGSKSREQGLSQTAGAVEIIVVFPAEGIKHLSGGQKIVGKLTDIQFEISPDSTRVNQSISPLHPNF